MDQYREGNDDGPPVKTRNQIVEERLQALQDDPVVEEEVKEDPAYIEEEDSISTAVLLVKMKDGRVHVETNLPQIPLDHQASPAEVATILEETKETMFITRLVNAIAQVQKMVQMEAMSSMLGKKGGKVNPRELLSQLRRVPR